MIHIIEEVVLQKEAIIEVEGQGIYNFEITAFLFDVTYDEDSLPIGSLIVLILFRFC